MMLNHIFLSLLIFVFLSPALSCGVKGKNNSAPAMNGAAKTTELRAGQEVKGGEYTSVVTPNGSTLPWKMVDGVKEFHLVVEEIEWEIAPGMKIKAWGYNGQTPGPTIEAVEGDGGARLGTTARPRTPRCH